MTVDPTGEWLVLPLTMLADSPLTDFQLPGFILLTMLGVLPLVVAWASYTRKRWSWYGVLLVGFTLVVWIGLQLALVGYHPDPPLQIVFGALGVVIVALAMLPSVREREQAKGGGR